MCVYEKDGKCQKFSDGEVVSYCVQGPCEAERDAHICTTQFAKAEAIKELLDRLKGYIGDDLYFEIETDVFITFLNNLGKEMGVNVDG